MYRKIIVIIALSTLLLAMPGIASADYDPWVTDPTLDDPALFLYIEGSSYNPSTSGDPWIAESWINPVAFSHGTTYIDYVDVVADNKQNYAENPYFFVWFKDKTLIDEIIVGKAQTFVLGVEESCDPHGCSPQTTFKPADFVDSLTKTGGPLSPNPNKHQGQTGYWVRTRIGDVPAVLNKAYGNPDNGDFNPANLQSYVRVPVTYTLTSDTAKDLTTLIIHYDAHNKEAESHFQSTTKNSHDSSSYNVPEFSTIAIPIASILGLLFFFNHRKRREK